MTLEYQLTPAITGESMTGKFFAFKVSALNVVGEGPLSDEAVLIAAKRPLAATNLAKVSADVT